jgi:hypothetical protein
LEPKVVEYLVQQAREEKDPESILYYARAFSLKAPVEYRDTLRRTVTRFPRSKAALAALMFLAQDAERNKDRVQILQRIRTEFAAFAPHATEAQKRVYSGEKLAAPAPVLYNGVMKDFFELMAKSNPAAALALAQEMVKANPQDEQWAATVEVQQGLVRAKSALAGGRLQLLYDGLTRPNGLGFSPDEKYLYVANSDSKRKIWMRFEVKPDGSLAGGKVFYDVTNQNAGGLPDGLKLDQRGNLYASGPGGIWIFSPEGKHLGTIQPPETPANCGWGDQDGKTLYITARTGLYRIKLAVAGIRP